MKLNKTANRRRYILRAGVIGLVLGGTAGLTAVAVADPGNDSTPKRSDDVASEERAERVRTAAKQRFPQSKDSIMEYVSACLEDRGAKFDSMTGNMSFTPVSDSDNKAMLDCIDDLAEDRPFRKR
jgi:hypothetical protein